MNAPAIGARARDWKFLSPRTISTHRNDVLCLLQPRDAARPPPRPPRVTLAERVTTWANPVARQTEENTLPSMDPDRIL